MKKSLKSLKLNKKTISNINASGGAPATITITIPKTIIYKTWWYGCGGGSGQTDYTVCA